MAQIAQKSMKATGKPADAVKTKTAKKEPIRFVPVSNEELMAAIEESREKNQPVLDYLKDK